MGFAETFGDAPNPLSAAANNADSQMETMNKGSFYGGENSRNSINDFPDN